MSGRSRSLLVLAMIAAVTAAMLPRLFTEAPTTELNMDEPPVQEEIQNDVVEPEKQLDDEVSMVALEVVASDWINVTVKEASEDDALLPELEAELEPDAPTPAPTPEPVRVEAQRAEEVGSPSVTVSISNPRIEARALDALEAEFQIHCLTDVADESEYDRLMRRLDGRLVLFEMRGVEALEIVGEIDPDTKQRIDVGPMDGFNVSYGRATRNASNSSLQLPAGTTMVWLLPLRIEGAIQAALREAVLNLGLSPLSEIDLLTGRYDFRSSRPRMLLDELRLLDGTRHEVDIEILM